MNLNILRPILKLFLCIIVTISSLAAHATQKNVVIFSQSVSKSDDALISVYEELGHKVKLMYYDQTHIIGNEIHNHNNIYRIDQFDIAYFRTWGCPKSRALAHQWIPIIEKNGVTIIDSLQALLYNHNKHAMMRLFINNDIPIPKTLIVQRLNIDALVAKISQVFKDKIVVKGDSCGGKDVIFIEIDNDNQLRKELLKISDNQKIKPPFVIQQYIPSKNSNGYSYHYRVVVVDFKPILALKYTSSEYSILASNLSLGGSSEPAELNNIFTTQQLDQIIRACKLMGVDAAGVDVLLTNQGLFILEVNNSLGLYNSYLMPDGSVVNLLDKAVKKIVEFSLKKEVIE